MEKMNSTRFTWFLEKSHLFLCVAFLVAVVSVALSTFYWGFFLLGIILLIMTWVMLDVSKHPLGSCVSLVWALISFAVFIGFACRPYVDEYGVEHFGKGVFVAGLICGLIYALAPVFSYWMKLVKKSSFGINIPTGLFVAFLLVGGFTVLEDSLDVREAQKEIAWQKTDFEPILSWQTEIWPQQGTVYLVTIKRGTFVVYPHSCPEIRRINKASKVRVMFKKTGAQPGIWSCERLEVQN